MSLSPADMLNELQPIAEPDDQGAPCAPRPAPPAARAARGGGARPPTDKQDTVLASISSCYFRLRRGLALIALLFPVVLWLRAGPGDLRTSISAYYHVAGDGGFLTTRDLFVGVMCAVGAFLYFYKGYSKREMAALNAAGLAALLIGLVPVDYPYDPDHWPSAAGLVHNLASLIFFLAIAYVCLRRSHDTLELIGDEGRRARFGRAYRLLGALMIVAPLTATGLHLLIPKEADQAYWVLAIEVAAIWVFASFWLVKSREIKAIEHQRRGVGLNLRGL